jgi:hypothetical protein
MSNDPHAIETLRAALLRLLERVDYIAGNCSATDPVGPTVPEEVIRQAREALDRTTPAHTPAHHATDDPILFLSIYSLDAGQAYVRQVLPAGVAHRVRFITDEEMLAGYPRGGVVFYNPDGPALPPGLVETMRAHDMTPRALLGPADLLI